MFARLAATQGGGLSVGHREYNCAHAEEGGRGNGPTRREAVVTVPCPALCRGRRCQRSWARWDASVQHLRQCQRVRMDQPGRLFLCARCRQQVVLCSRCDRGNRYCGRACWRLSREAAAREAGSRYQRSYRGRLAHAQRARRWRQRRAQAPQNVTHQGCPAEAANAPLLAWPHDTTTAIVELVEPDCAAHDKTPPPPRGLRGWGGGRRVPRATGRPPRKPSSRSTDADAAAYLWSPGCARASCGTPLAMRGGASVMTIGPDFVAQILRLHEVEKWRVGTIARQLHVHRDVVRRVLGGNSAPVHGSPLRASRIDVLRPFILETLTKFPALTAARL